MSRLPRFTKDALSSDQLQNGTSTFFVKFHQLPRIPLPVIGYSFNIATRDYNEKSYTKNSKKQLKQDLNLSELPNDRFMELLLELE